MSILFEEPPMPLDRPSLHFARRPADATPEAPVASRFSRARQLAAEIEDLLGSATPAELQSTGYAVRLAQGLTRSLIDQLEELHRGPASSRLTSPLGSAVRAAEPASVRDRRMV